MSLVAVTGASGHIGGNLVRALVAQGRRVRVLVHARGDRASLDGLAVERVRGDVLAPETLAPLLDGAEACYHLAARISISRDDAAVVRRTNVDGTRRVVDACLAAGVRRLVHFSSIHALCGDARGAPIDESRENAGPGALPYDASKAAAEREVLAGCARGLDAVIVNPSGAIGPHDHEPSRMGEVLLALARGRMPGLVDAGFHWVDVRDVVAGALAACERGRRGERYLLAGAWAAMPELAAHVAAASGVPAPRLIAPMALARVGAPFVEAWSRVARTRPLYTPDSLRILMHHRGVSTAKAERELGFSARPLAETIADTLAWFRAAGRL